MALPCSRGLAGRGARLLSAAATRRSGNAPAPLRTATRLVSSPVAAGNGAPSLPVRCFGSSAPLLKKRKIAGASNSPAAAAAPSTKAAAQQAASSRASEPNPEEPLDLSMLAAAFEPVDAAHAAQLTSVLHGGRFDPARIAALAVTVKPEAGGDAATGGTFPLGELAQVVPRSGRALSLLVNDRAYVRPIMSAVQASPDFNQQPQRAPDNDLELLLRVELERKEDLQRRVRDVAQGWRDAVRRARTRHEKVVKDWRKRGVVLPDVAARVERELQKVQDKKMQDIAAEEARALKQLERN